MEIITLFIAGFLFVILFIGFSVLFGYFYTLGKLKAEFNTIREITKRLDTSELTDLIEKKLRDAKKWEDIKEDDN